MKRIRIAFLGRCGWIAAAVVINGTPMTAAPATPVLRAVSVGVAAPTLLRTPRGASGGANWDGAGQYGVFVSDAPDLLAEGVVGRGTEVYLRDGVAATNRLISVAIDGIHGGGGDSGNPTISRDGRKVAFESDSTQLVKGEAGHFRAIYLRDWTLGETRRISPAGPTNGPAGNPILSADGNSVVFTQLVSDPSNGERAFQKAILRVDLISGVLERIAGARGQVDPDRIELDAAGGVVVFHRDLSQLVPVPGAVATDLWVRRAADLEPIPIVLPIATNGLFAPVFTFNATVSSDGTTLAFRTATENTNASGVWWLDLTRGVPVRISDRSESRLNAFDDSTGPVLSGNGRVVAFQAGVKDGPYSPLRLWSPETGLRQLTEWVATGGASFEPQQTAEPVLSHDGSRLAYLSPEAHPQAGVPVSGVVHAYVRDLSPGTTREVGEVRDSDDVVLQFTSEDAWLSMESELPLHELVDRNAASDVVLVEVGSGKRTPISVAGPSGPVPPMGLAHGPSVLGSTVGAVSDDGTKVVFQSAADDLVPGGTGGPAHAYVRDLATGMTRAVGVTPDGALLSAGSSKPVISGDGTRVAFLSTTSLLVPGDTNLGYKVFVRDLETGTTQLASAPDSKVVGGGFSAVNIQLSQTGHRVLFDYLGADLAPKSQPTLNLFLRDLDSRRTYALTSDPTGKSTFLGNVKFGSARLDGEGTKVTYLAVRTPYRWRMSDGGTERLGPDEFAGFTFAMEASGDGDRLMLYARPGGTSDVLSWYDVATRSNHVILRSLIKAVSVTSVGMSRDGTKLVYSGAIAPTGEALLDGTRATYVYDIPSGQFRRLGLSPTSAAPTGIVDSASLSADGRWVAFRSQASNLVPGDENDASDVFVQDLVSGTTTLLSRSPKTGRAGNQLSARPSISADGSRVAFVSFADDLVEGDLNGFEDVFVADVPQWLRLTTPRWMANGAIEVKWVVPSGVQSRLEWSSVLDPGATWEVVPVDPGLGIDAIGTEVVRTFFPRENVRFLRVRTF